MRDKRRGKRFSRGELDGAAGQAAELAGAADFDHAVAGIFAAAIDAQDSHASMKCIAESTGRSL